MKIRDLSSLKITHNFTRGSYDAAIQSLVFDPKDDILIFITSSDSIHLFELTNKYSKGDEFKSSKGIFSSVQSGISYYWAGDIRSRFILEKPKNMDVDAFFSEEEIMLVNREKKVYKQQDLSYILKSITKKSTDREKIEFD